MRFCRIIELKNTQFLMMITQIENGHGIMCSFIHMGVVRSIVFEYDSYENALNAMDQYSDEDAEKDHAEWVLFWENSVTK